MKKFKIISLFLVGCILFSCRQNDNRASAYLNEKEIAYEEICVQKGLEVWSYYTYSVHPGDYRAKDEFVAFFDDEVLKENISKWYREKRQIKDDTLRSRIEIWNKIITCAQVNFDPEIVQLQTDLEKKLAGYPSNEHTYQQLETEIVKLVKRRNQKARSLGYGNYAHMVLQNTGIDTLWFENLIHIIDSSTAIKYSEFVQKISKNGVRPNYADIMEYVVKNYQLNDLYRGVDFDKKGQMEKILQNIGIEINDLPIQFTFNNLPPGIGGFGNAIHIPDDFRAVARKDLSYYYLMHEIGHGLQWTNVNIQYPVLKGYEWCMGNIPCFYYEAMAEVVAKFSSSSIYLKELGYTQHRIDSINHLINELKPLFLRYQLVNSLFEIALYKNPEKTPAIIKQELYEKYLLVEKDFSAKPNLLMLSYVSYPVYEQNYLIADMVSWQVHRYLKNKFGQKYFLNKQVGEFLANKLWQNGELTTYELRIKNATDQRLDIQDYVRSKLD